MTSKSIQIAADRLQNGELVAIPTETVYGLAASAYNEKAVQAIFTTKNRPSFNPLIVHIGHIDQLDELVREIPQKAATLMHEFWPGAITLVLPKHPTLNSAITAGKDTVAVRMPNHPLTLDLLQKIDFPLVAPSANPFNQISPTRAEHVSKYFSEQEVFVLDGGPCELGLESTIVGFEEEEVVLYREGAIAQEKIEALVGKLTVKNQNDQSPQAPGMLKKHYSPLTPFYLVSDIQKAVSESNADRIGVLSFAEPIVHERIVTNLCLSPRADLHEAAANLYAYLHMLDAQNLDVLYAEPAPHIGLGKSINDRLNRANNQ